MIPENGHNCNRLTYRSSARLNFLPNGLDVFPLSGNTAQMRKQTPNDRFDLWSMPVPWSGCWIWFGSGTSEGYGRFEINGRKILAHRFSYERFVGSIPNGIMVLHTCDQPSCVNPKHLFLGTNQTNTDDKVRKGRHAKGIDHSYWCRGEQMHMSKLTEDLVIMARNDPRSQQVIADSLGVSQTLISLIKRRIIWKHVK
jgi:hypothetical protein